MAFLPTNASQVQQFAVALYGIKVGTATMSAVQNDITTVGGLNNALNAYYVASFGSSTTASVAASVAANLGLTGTAATDAAAYITAVLNSTPANARGVAIQGVVTLFSTLTSNATFGAAATAWNTKIASAISYTGAGDVALVPGAATVGDVFTLTAGADIFNGTAGNDTFTADNTGTDTTSTSDALNGGDGADTLNVFSDGAAGALPTLTSIETANIYDQDADLVVTSNAWDSVTTLNLIRGDGETAVSLGDKATAISLTDIVLSDTAADNAVTVNGVTVNFDAALVAGTVGLSGITAAGTDADENVIVTGTALKTLNVNVTTDSTFDALDAAAATTININATGKLTTTLATTGTATLNLSGAGAVDIGTLDADINTVTSTASGKTTLAIGGNVDTVVTLGSGADVVTASTTDTIATADTLAVNAGEGTDILVVTEAADLSSAAEGARYTGFETLRLVDDQNVSYVSGLTGLELGASTGKAFTALTAAVASNVNVIADLTTATVALATATGTSDALTLKMGTGLTTSAATDIVTGITVTGFETVNIQENGGATAASGADRTAIIAAFSTPTTLKNVNLTGRAVTLSNVATTVAVTIDGTALTGDGATTSVGLTVAGSAVAGSTIKGSEVKDSLTIGAEGSTYLGNGGNDTFTTTAAILAADGSTDVVINGGAGTDTLVTSDTTTTLTDNNFTNVSGMEKLTLSNTFGDASLTTGSAFNAAFATGATIVTGVLAATKDATIAAGLATVPLTITVDATDLVGTATEANSITTGSAADTVTFTGDSTYVGVNAATQGTIAISTRAGDDTISVTVGTLLASTGGNAITITGGTGADTITKVGTNSTTVTSVAQFVMAAGDSSTTAWDKVTGFDVADGTKLSDVLDFSGTAAVSAFTATEDVGVIKSHSITAGLATFDDAADFSTALVINASNLADVVSYLATNTATDGTVAFAYDSDASGTADAMMVFHNGTTDDLVMLVGITTGSLHATLTTTTAGTIGIA